MKIISAEQKKIVNIHWTETRLNEEEMLFLNQIILDEEYVAPYDINPTLAGNISKSDHIKDKDNWFYETVLKKQTEKLFLSTDNNYYKYYVEKKEPLPEFEMNRIWVNYQKKHEFNPLHNHSGLYSFVIFMKIPTHWEEQHALPFSANSNAPCASDFQFVWSEENVGTEKKVINFNFPLSPEDEGKMLFFPAWLKHQVFPFYGTEEKRVTISGNIVQKEKNQNVPPISEYKEKEDMLKVLENHVEMMKKELKQRKIKEEMDSFLKKEGEKEG